MIELAVIGCGHWGPNHVRIFNSLPESRLGAVVDLDEEKLRSVHEMYPEIRCEPDYRTVLEDPSFDAVVVATPVSSHYKIVRESILAGKHVLCEKPLCENSEQAEELLGLAQAEGRVLMVGHVFLFNPGVMKLKELVDTGELGELQYLSASRANLGAFAAISTWLTIWQPTTSPSSTGCWAASPKSCQRPVPRSSARGWKTSRSSR